MGTGDVAVARVDREAAFGRLAETHLDAAYRLATLILFAAHCGTRVACLRREGRVLGGPIAPSKQTRTLRHANARRLHRRKHEH